jgi:uncharacterized protein YbjQ (UPF0145 family)
MAIFDIDNTILDPEQRFIDARRAGVIDKDGAPKGKGGWKARGDFLYTEDRLLKDRVMDNSMDLIEHLMEKGYVIAYCTARPFAHYEATKYQLEQKGFPLFQNGAGEDLLFCKRSMGQKTPLYKKGVVETLQAQYDVRLFFDDQPENLAAALQADVPGVYASVQEYYGMIKGVRSNGTLNMRGGRAEDPDAEIYLPGSDSMGRTYLDQERRTPKTIGTQKTLKEFNNPNMYSKKSLEMAYESIKGTKIQTEPGPGMKMCGTCVYMCQQSAKCKKWTEIKGEPVYVVADWYCGAWEETARGNPVKRGSDSKGSYYRWGKNQKYYYKTGSKTSRENARKKAHKQAKAAFAGGYRGNPDDPDPEVIVRYETIDGHRMPVNAYGLVPPSEHKRVVAETAKLRAKIDQLAKKNPHDEGIIRSEMMEPVWKMRVRYILDQEGGASGLDPLMKAFPKGTTKKEARKLLTKVHDVRKHSAGDYIWDNPRRNGEEHSEDYMVPRDVDTLGKAADRIRDNYYEGLEVPEWWKSKLSVTADRADSLADAISYVADNPRKANSFCNHCEKYVDLFGRCGCSQVAAGMRNPPGEILKIYSGEPKSKFKNMGVVFAEVQIGRNIAKDVGEVVQSVYRGLIGGRTSMAERRMAMAIASMQKELSDRATDAGGNAIANLKVDYEIVQGTATLTIIAHADAIKMARKPKSNPPQSEAVSQGVSLYREIEGDNADSWADNPEVGADIDWGYMEELFPLAKYLKGTLSINYYDIHNIELKDFDTLKEAVNSYEIRMKKLHAKDPKKTPWLKDIRYFDYDEVNEGFARGVPSKDVNFTVDFTKRNLKRFQKLLDNPRSNPRSNPPKSKVEKGKELYKHMNGKTPERTETKTIDIGDVWYQVGEGGCWEIGYMSGKETGSSSQKYRHTFNEETKNGDFPKLYATIPDKGKPMLIITGGTWKIKTDEDGVAWIYD